MTRRADLLEVARSVFGWKQLRPGQAEAIEAVVSGRDVLVVMPTGYGKSAIYQVAAHLLDGPTLVVSPLIALQADQVRHLEAADAGSAVAVNSANSARTNERAWQAIATGAAEFVFLAPEQLAKPEVLEELAGLGFGLVVIDEAHCVSSWGHDFRPDYLRLGAAIEALGHPPVVALTATGSAPVRREIIDRLGLDDPRVLVGGFDRPNIHLAVQRHEDEAAKERAIAESVSAAQSPGLVYVATRKETERYAEQFRAEGLRAAAYHGGMGARDRRGVHEAFLADDLDVVVATSAFGMGVDKPNVRFVVHGDVTESVDAYYQEVGRGGRDREPAEAVLHYRPEDLALRRFFASGRPDRDRVTAVAAALSKEAATARDLAARIDLPVRAVTGILNALVEGGAVELVDDAFLAPGPIGADAAVRMVEEIADRRERIDESRLAMIRSFAETTRCRRAFLLEYFGDELAEPCGNCDTCDRGTAYEQGRGERADAGDGRDGGEGAGYLVDQLVRHREWGEGRVMSVESDRMTVFFDDEGYRVLSLEAIAEGGLLESA